MLKVLNQEIVKYDLSIKAAKLSALMRKSFNAIHILWKKL